MSRAVLVSAMLLPLLIASVGGRSAGVAAQSADPVTSPPVSMTCPTPAARTAIMDPPPGTFVALTDLPARLSEAQQRWQDAGITDYCITVEYIAFIANAGSRTLEVRDGNIIAGPRLCIGPSNNCLTEGEHGYDYTVPGLFALLQRELNDPGRQVDLIAFDATYGYPIWISTNTSMRGVTDLGRMWTVTSFIPLT